MLFIITLTKDSATRVKGTPRFSDDGTPVALFIFGIANRNTTTEEEKGECWLLLADQNINNAARVPSSLNLGVQLGAELLRMECL